MDAITLRRLRCAAQGLAEPVADPVGRLLAVQAQDGAAAWRAVAVRGGARDGQGLVLTWLLRGTLHLVRTDDAPWLHGLLASRRAARHRRRLAQEGVDERRWRDVARLAPATRAQLGAALGLEGQGLVHLIALAAMHGSVTLDPEDRRVLPAELPTTAPDGALARLGGRYLAGHAPAGAPDLARWAGIPLGEARVALADARAPAHEPRPVPRRELGPFDPYLLGWADRSFAVPAHLARAVHPGGGMVRACVIEDGLVVG